MANYEANIQIKVPQLSAAEKLEKALKGIEERLEKIQKLGTSKVNAAVSGGGTRGASQSVQKRAEDSIKRQNKLLREQADLRLRQIRIVQQKTQNLGEQRQIMSRLRDATNNVISDQRDSIRLGQTQITNARAMVREEENRLRALDKQNQLLQKQASATRSVGGTETPGGGGGSPFGGTALATAGVAGAAAAMNKAQALTAAPPELIQNSDRLQRMEQQRLTNLKGIQDAQEEINKDLKEAADINRRLNQVRNSKNPAATKNLQFGGEYSRKGLEEIEKYLQRINKEIDEVQDSVKRGGLIDQRDLQVKQMRADAKLTPDQAFRRARDDRERLLSGAAGKKIDLREQKGAYADLAAEVRKLSGDERRRAMKAVDASDKVARKLERDAQRAKRGFLGLGRVVDSVVGALVALGAVRITIDAFKVSAQIEQSEVRIKALSEGFDDYQSVMSVVTRGQELFNQTQLEANEAFGKAYARLRPLGLTLEQIQAVYEGFNTAAINSGTTAAEAAGAWTQLVQAIGSGTLRGEELNSILEQTPAISQAIAKQLGTTVGNLKEYGRQGKISSETVLKALVAVRNEGIGKLDQMMDGPIQKFKKLEIAVEKLKKVVGEVALDGVIESVELLGDAILALEGPIRLIFGLANNALGQIISLINIATKPKAYAAAQDIKAGRLPFAGLGGLTGVRELFEGTGPEGRGFDGIREQARELARLRNQPIRDVELQLMQDRLKTMEAAQAAQLGPLNIDTTLEGLNSDLDGGGTKKDLADELKDLVQRGELAKAAYEYERMIAAARALGNEQLAIELQGMQRMAQVYETAKGRAQTIEGGVNGTLGQQILSNAETEIQRIALQTAERSLQFQKRQEESRTRINQQLDETIAKYANIFEQENQSYQSQQQIQRLITEGINPQLAEQLVNIENQVAEKLKVLDADIAIAEAEKIKAKAAGVWTTELEKQLDLLKAQRGQIVGQGQDQVARVQEQNSPQARLTDAVAQAKGNLAELQDPINLIINGANAIGEAFGAAFKEVVKGTMSVQEAFASMMQRVADHFINAAAQMAAEYLTLITLQTILNAIGGPSLGGNMGGKNYFDGVTGKGIAGPNFGLATGGRALPNGSYIVGERGPEVFTPDSPGTVQSNRYFDAARDSMSIDADAAANKTATERDDRMDEMAAGFYESAGKPLELETTVINEVEYATVDQVRKSANAAVQEARARMISDLRNYPARRGQVGLR